MVNDYCCFVEINIVVPGGEKEFLKVLFCSSHECMFM